MLSLLLTLLLHPGAPAAPAPDPHAVIRGMTISCQTWGWEWGTPGFAAELEELRGLGANWVAIHPYARIDADGTVRWREQEADEPPGWLTGPVGDAHAAGMRLMVKPHLAYWGSPFSWRGEIAFDDPAARARFWRTYTAWITDVARATAGADAFVVGTELDRMLDDEDEWRDVVAAVRGVTEARLTYAANWSDFERVPFWDALDAIGVQAYFPLEEAPPEGTEPGTDGPAELPSAERLRAGWLPVLERLRQVHERTGKPIVFTELGYDVSPLAAREPWRDGRVRGPERAAAETLQERCYAVALEVLARESGWLRGAFLWKWFVGEPGRGDRGFALDVPRLCAVLRAHWDAGD